MRKWKLKLRHSGIVIDADERPTKLKLRVASFRYSYCLLLLRMHCFLRLHCLVWLHCLYIVASQFQGINVVQRQMLRAIVGWVAADGNECGRFLRRMNNVKTILIILSDLHMDGFFIQTGLFLQCLLEPEGVHNKDGMICCAIFVNTLMVRCLGFILLVNM